MAIPTGYLGVSGKMFPNSSLSTLSWGWFLLSRAIPVIKYRNIFIAVGTRPLSLTTTCYSPHVDLGALSWDSLDFPHNQLIKMLRPGLLALRNCLIQSTQLPKSFGPDADSHGCIPAWVNRDLHTSLSWWYHIATTQRGQCRKQGFRVSVYDFLSMSQ